MTMSKSKKLRLNAERRDRDRKVRELQKRIDELRIPRYAGPCDKLMVTTAGSRIGAQTSKCCGCGEPIGAAKVKRDWDDVLVVVTEVKVSRFRGDDQVEFFHPECFITKHLHAACEAHP